MTKPVSRLEWFADPLNPMVIRAKWIGAGWHYRLHWGDGTSERVLFTQPPVRHVYPAAGTYTLTASSEINKVQVSVQVTVRPEKTPQFGSEPLGDGRVRLTIKGGWPGDILHRVLWGDDTLPEEYTSTNLTPEHTYPAGMTEAQITVQDVPARRVGTITAHIEPPKPGGELRWWFTETSDRDHPVLHVDGLKPGAVWTLYGYGLGHDQIATGTVTAGGTVNQPVELWDANTIRNNWLGFTVVEAVGSVERRIYPAYYRRWVPEGVYPLFDWFPDDPALITLHVFRPGRGTYTIDFGDGTELERYNSDGFSVAVEHRYTDPDTARTITVTDPAGTTGTLRVGPCRLSYAGFNGRYWLDFAYGMPLPDWDHNGFLPGRTDWDDGKGLLATIPIASTANDGTKPVVVSHIYGKEHNGRTVTATVSAPWSTPVSKTVTIKEGLGRDFPLRLDARFAITESWPGGYSGEFIIRNPLTTPVDRWLLDFQLPAVITDVWPNTAQLQPIRPGRYAITSSTNLDPNNATYVGIRVEHAGDPAPQPTEIRATATKKEIDSMASKSAHAPALVAGGYINPGKQAKLIVLHVPPFVSALKLQSEAFATREWIDATITGTGPERIATATVKIADGIEPDRYEVTGDLGHGWKPPWELLVEEPSDGKAAVTVTKVDDKGLMRLKVEGVSRNLARGISGNAAGVQAATALAAGGAESWFGLVYDWSTGSAANNFVLADNVEPGKPYEIKIKQHFHGGHTEIITGTATLPREDKTKPGLRQFTTIHHINLAKLGDGDTIVHTIKFGDGFKQTNTNYTYDAKLKTIDPTTGKPVKPTLQEAQQLTLLRNEYHFVRHTTYLELHTLNPHTLRGNSRFQPIFIVTVFPVEDDASYASEIEEIA